MTENNLDETISNITETNIKEELYILYLEIKGELLKRCIEIDKSQFDENVSNYNIKTLLNYLKEIIYILLNNKFKINEKENLSEESININVDNNMINSKLSQLENETIKYQADIRNLTKKLFQYKIQKDAMELKIKTYIEIEKEYDLLKEKVKYEEGRFLNNDRKDNEILILRTENSNLKKEIIKNENNTKNYELIIKTEQQKIKDLKNQINQLNKKLLLLESNHASSNISSNNFSTIHNSSITNVRTSFRWSKRKEKDDMVQSNNSHKNTYGNLSIKKKKKIMNAKYSKLEMKGIGNLNERTLSRGNSNSIINVNHYSKKKKNGKGISTIDNNNNFSETYNKILGSLINHKMTNISNKKTIATSHKKNSISVCMENIDKMDENSKYNSNKITKNKSGSKHKIYRKIMNGIPNSKFPMTSKHRFNKNLIPSLPQKFFIKNNSSFLNIKGKTKENFHFE